MSKIVKDDDYCVCCGEYCGTSTQICAKCKKGLENISNVLQKTGVTMEEAQTSLRQVADLLKEAKND